MLRSNEHFFPSFAWPAGMLPSYFFLLLIHCISINIIFRAMVKSIASRHSRFSDDKQEKAKKNASKADGITPLRYV